MELDVLHRHMALLLVAGEETQTVPFVKQLYTKLEPELRRLLQVHVVGGWRAWGKTAWGNTGCCGPGGQDVDGFIHIVSPKFVQQMPYVAKARLSPAGAELPSGCLQLVAQM
jgi:hypothetical protein